MGIYCVGISHRTTPVEVRERYAIPDVEIPGVLSTLCRSGGVEEAVWLSTCNRVELYLVAEGWGEERLLEAFAGWRGPSVDRSPKGVYVFREPGSVEHLFRVASGLDSMVLGETEVLGQLKRAYELAQRHGHTGARLNRGFQRAFQVAKQVRSETQIQRGGISVASVGVELAERIFESVSGRSVLVLGAGETGEKVARALMSRGAGTVWIANRSWAKAEALAHSLGPPAVPVRQWEETVMGADVLISSTSAMGHVLGREQVEEWMARRHRRPLLLIDLAVPRDVDPAVISVPGVYLFNVDDLSAIAEAHRRRREAEVERCQEIIRARVDGLLESWARMPGVPPSMSAASS